jgi:hypothetical protein
MLGFKSLEEKLRAGNGATAKATVLEHKAGIHSDKGVDPAGFGGTDVTRHHFRLRVEPDGGEPFEAKAVVRADQLWPMPQPGAIVPVFYDPDDHDKVAIDTKAAGAQQQADQDRLVASVQQQGIAKIEQMQERLAAVMQPQESAPDTVAELQKLADLHARGALTEAEFETEKAKLLAQ